MLGFLKESPAAAVPPSGVHAIPSQPRFGHTYIVACKLSSSTEKVGSFTTAQARRQQTCSLEQAPALRLLVIRQRAAALHFQALAVCTHGRARVAPARRQRAWRDVALVVRAALAAIAGLRAIRAAGSALSPATLSCAASTAAQPARQRPPRPPAEVTPHGTAQLGAAGKRGLGLQAHLLVLTLPPLGACSSAL